MEGKWVKKDRHRGRKTAGRICPPQSPQLHCRYSYSPFLVPFFVCGGDWSVCFCMLAIPSSQVYPPERTFYYLRLGWVFVKNSLLTPPVLPLLLRIAALLGSCWTDDRPALWFHLPRILIYFSIKNYAFRATPQNASRFLFRLKFCVLPPRVTSAQFLFFPPVDPRVVFAKAAGMKCQNWNVKYEQTCSVKWFSDTRFPHFKIACSLFTHNVQRIYGSTQQVLSLKPFGNRFAAAGGKEPPTEGQCLRWVPTAGIPM